ncbi:toxin-antitoxin system YwqK family antitoxin [Neptunitalea lumnitzerae]|uniref:Nicotinic acid mononucleotide adenyltransferase n=1 Tax=Neptunitalea lumnitzerae TaxID=2965509 RepID=A0ABQ5MHB1_9FLAO|nr:nicotinic acid mononucleotide adenyltransferase [Neptunitalea sp. Y10]GLB48774.1 hypothetical protein Y10_11420 [Neptunitalea sp. Y10]
MKKIIFTLAMVFTLAGFAQQEKPVLEKQGDLVKATYTNEEGVVTQIGFFKDGKPHGEWVAFDDAGKKIAMATYDEGKKVNTWFFWTDNKKSLSEVEFDNNEIKNVTNWSSMDALATNP